MNRKRVKLTFISSVKQYITDGIWKLDDHKLSSVQAFLLRHLRIAILVIRNFIQDRVRVRASALVYATLMSIVPLLAVVFSLLKGFGFHNRLEPLLVRFLEPLGEQAIQMIIPTVMDFVTNARVAALGGIGFLVFLLASISIVKNMERAFNDIWQVEKTRRLRDHLSGIVLIPLMAFAVLAVTTSLQNYALVKTLSNSPVIRIFENKAAPLLLTWLVFFFFLNFIPNTKVRLLSSLYGAAIAGSLWQLLNFYFTVFFVRTYNQGTMAAVYAGFVAVPLFLIWLYFSWLIFLLGAEITFVHQNLPKITWEAQSQHVSWRVKETITLKTILLIGQKFSQGQKAPTQTELAEYLNVPEYAVTRLLTVLSELELVNVIEQRGEAGYAPAKSLEAMSLRETMEKMRAYGALFKRKDQEDNISLLVEDLQGRYEEQLSEVFADTNLRDLLDKINEGKEKT